ncbi:uncharacterized protein BJX67DRAFT_162618 [Aspergillus lucknowensis]|uniref:Uncharacterized protein n=1 Tax=Aspergillus lucknowensis TaxID=176173 RepID=A0ABR4M4G0_9EURO
MKGFKSRLKRLAGRRNLPGYPISDAERELASEQMRRLENSESQDGSADWRAKILMSAQDVLEAKWLGGLLFTIRMPSASSRRISAHVHRYGEEVTGQSLLCSIEHPSFRPYRIQKKFMKRELEDEPADEDNILLEAEAYPAYENVNPGTVTVEGFGIDYWDAEILHGRLQIRSLVPFPDMPDFAFVPAVLLRRVEEARCTQAPLSQEDEAAIISEVLGQEVWDFVAARSSSHAERVVTLIYDLLKRIDISTVMTVSQPATTFNEGTSEGGWSFFVYMILGKVLALRLEEYGDAGVFGFNDSAFATMILSNLWFQNTRLELIDQFELRADVSEAMMAGISPQERERAEELMRQGDNAAADGQIEVAGDLYSQAIQIDLANYGYIKKRAELMFAIENYQGAAKEALVLSAIDPTRADSYVVLGRACMKYKNYARARDAFQRATQLATDEEKEVIMAEMAKAEAADAAEIQAIDQETDERQKLALVRARQEAKLDPSGRAIKLLPANYGRQLEGLLLFAERMKWPYLSEVRQGFDKAYRDWRNNEPMWFVQQDWMYGVMLPGASFAYILMNTLICSTPSLEYIGPSKSQESGLALPQCSYWRIRSVLGRVLGCLPGVTSLNGWIGPCPAARIRYPEDETLPQHCVITTLYFNPSTALLKPPKSSACAADPLLDEQQGHEMVGIIDPSEWVTLDPPTQEDSTWELESFNLQRWKQVDPTNPNSAWLYNAYLEFRILDNWRETMLFKMEYNPVFVTLPHCSPNEGSQAHEVHRRELLKYKRQEISVNTIDDYQPFTSDDEIMVINATASGAEVVARAWCAQHGKTAVVRTSGGPCYACALRAASRYGLRTGVLIWVS